MKPEFPQDAHCKSYDPDIFFPNDGKGVIAAQNICAKCIVVNECLEYALNNHIDHGVWGGKSEKERRLILRFRRRSRLGVD